MLTQQGHRVIHRVIHILYIESSFRSWGHYAVFNMALYTLSYELTEGWEIADHLTLTVGMDTTLKEQALIHEMVMTPEL